MQTFDVCWGTNKSNISQLKHLWSSGFDRLLWSNFQPKVDSNARLTEIYPKNFTTTGNTEIANWITFRLVNLLQQRLRDKMLSRDGKSNRGRGKEFKIVFEEFEENGWKCCFNHIWKNVLSWECWVLTSSANLYALVIQVSLKNNCDNFFSGLLFSPCQHCFSLMFDEDYFKSDNFFPNFWFFENDPPRLTPTFSFLASRLLKWSQFKIKNKLLLVSPLYWSSWINCFLFQFSKKTFMQEKKRQGANWKRGDN